MITESDLLRNLLRSIKKNKGDHLRSMKKNGGMLYETQSLSKMQSGTFREESILLEMWIFTEKLMGRHEKRIRDNGSGDRNIIYVPNSWK